MLNIFRGEKKDNLGFLPRSGKSVDRKAKKSDLEDIADEYMRKEEYSVQSDKYVHRSQALAFAGETHILNRYGVNLEPNASELAEDVPHEVLHCARMI